MRYYEKFRITGEVEVENTIEINYLTEYGKGKMILNLDNILPCPVHDFKLIISTIKKATFSDRADCIGVDDTINKLNDYIIAVINICKSEREALNKNFQKDRISELNGIMKKYIRLNNLLADEFDVGKVTDEDATIRMKKATVYALFYDRVEMKRWVKTFDGWTFTKNGLVFDVYDRGEKNKPHYMILLHGTGSCVVSTRKKNEIIPSITDKIIDDIKADANGIIANLYAEYTAAMIEAGFIEPEIQAAEPAENVVEITKAETPAENVAETTNKHNDIDITTIRRVYYIAFPLASDCYPDDITSAYHDALMIRKNCDRVRMYHGHEARIMPHNYIMPVSSQYPASAACAWTHRQDKGHCIRGSPTNIFPGYTMQSRWCIMLLSIPCPHNDRSAGKRYKFNTGKCTIKNFFTGAKIPWKKF